MWSTTSLNRPLTFGGRAGCPAAGRNPLHGRDIQFLGGCGRIPITRLSPSPRPNPARSRQPRKAARRPDAAGPRVPPRVESVTRRGHKKGGRPTVPPYRQEWPPAMRLRLVAVFAALLSAGVAVADPVTRDLPAPPAAATKPVPQSLDDLKAIQDHARAVLDKV